MIALFWNKKPKSKLLERLEQYKRHAWIPVVEAKERVLVSSKFSGKPYLKADETWPQCPNCGNHMHLFLQLNINEIPDEFKQSLDLYSGLLQMFYCTNSDPLCEVDCEAFFPFSKSVIVRYIAEIDNDKAIKDISLPEDSFPVKTIVKWNMVDDYPNWEELREMGFSLNDEEENELEKLEVPHAGDKLGGWPYWIQGIEYPRCPICNEKMRLIFQIDSEKNIPYMFGDTGCGHITQCKNHKDQMAFAWACC